MAELPDKPTPEPSAHREPPLRPAVFLRPVVWGSAVALLALGLAAGLWFKSNDGASPSPPPTRRGPFSGPAAETPPAPPVKVRVPRVTRFADVSYTELVPWSARLGYAAGKMDAAGEITLRGGDGRELRFAVDKREARLDGMRVFLGEPVLLRDGELFVATIDMERFLQPILTSASLATRPLRTIVIDAGHGGNDSGTHNRALRLEEKTFTLDVARRLERLLKGENENWRVLQTREDDRYIPLGDRAAFANAKEADLFISIHFNAVANNAKVRGTETYVLTPRHQRSTSSLEPSADDKREQVGNRHDVWNAVLGIEVHRHLLARLKSDDRGYKRARFAVLRLVDCPGVLVEAGYLSNDAEAKRIADEDYRQDIAEALNEAILAYSKALENAGRGN